MPALPTNFTTGGTLSATQYNATNAAVNGLNQAGTFASLPAAGFPGALYQATDNGNLYRDNGTAWNIISIAGTGLSGVAPASTGWSTTTLGSSTFTADKDGYILNAVAVGSNSETLRMQYRTLTATSNYTATFYMDWQLAGAVNNAMVIAVGDGTKWVDFGLQRDGGTSLPDIRVFQHTNATTYSSTPFAFGTAKSALYTTARWWRIRDDGTNHYFGVSLNGIDWVEVYSQSRTAWLTPSVIGWGANVYGSNYTALARMRSLTGA